MDYLKNKKVYLSGPIEFDEGNWREPVIEKLQSHFGMSVYDPFSDPKQQWKEKIHEAKKNKDYSYMRDLAKKFVLKDLTQVNRSDVLIAYLPYKVPTIGTHTEIIKSLDNNTPTILICPQGKENLPVWYFGMADLDMMFGSWNEVFSYLSDVDKGVFSDNEKWMFVYGNI